ncbi:MAG: hypothetical protein IH947_07410 [Bacteroidetes bacterium]|nr:hypothetical protein [Bacteroidota bacterium]
MGSIILKSLNARPEESTKVYLLLLQGFFTGIFLATYDVGAVTIFLQYFEESSLAWAFVASGVVGVFATYLYAYLQARVSFPSLVIGYLISIFLVSSFVWYGLTFYDNFEPIAFTAFVFALPFTYIGLLIFWGTFGRIFTVRQAKRIIGGIDTGQLVASILALFTIGFIIENAIITIVQLFLLSMFALVILLASFIIISVKFSLREEAGEKKKTFPIPKMIRNKYLRLMIMFVLISIVAITFVDYAFLSATQTQWPDPNDLGAFIARFEATVVIFSFLFQTFVTDWVIDNYGLKLALLINPALIIILVVISGMLGAFSEQFVWFFLAISITKLFIDSLRDALDGPTFKLYFLPIDSTVRFDVNTKIEGVATAFAAIIAGLLLILMNTLKLDLIVVIFIIIPALIAWFFTTGKMHFSYRTTLQETLSNIKSNVSSFISKGYKEEITPDEVRENEASVYYSLKLMERLEPEDFENSIKKLAGNIPTKGKLFEYTRKKLAQIDMNASRELAEKAVKEAEKGGGVAISDPDLYEMAKSIDIETRITAAIYLRSHISDENVFVLLELLRDISSIVRMEAMKTARKVKRPETWVIVTDMLSSVVFGNEAAATLYAGGDDVLPVINQVFQKSDQSKDALQRVVQIMGRLGSEKAIDYLWDKVEYPDRKIVREILLSIRNANFKPDESHAARINAQLDIEIGKAFWNIASQSEIIDKDHNQDLIDSLNYEIESNFEFIYIYLSILYDPASIQLVKENVELGTADGITYATELLDVFISKELKPKLFPLIDDITVSEKLEKVQEFYPRISFNELQTFNYIVNRDFNYINRWTKACALHCMSFHPGTKINQGLIAHLFNPDLLLAENAALVIRKLSEDRLTEIIDRLPDDRRYYLKDRMRSATLVGEVEEKNKLRFSKTLMLSTLDVFKPVVKLHLSQFVEKIHVVKIRKGEAYDLAGYKGSNPLIIAETGESELFSTDNSYKLRENEVFGAFFLDNEDTREYKIRATQHCVLYLLDLSDFLGVLTNFRDLASEVLENIEINDNKTHIVKA